eukprot:CAMPEP_0174260066 /NCGR_PEP_ID=MMETSP0439-20130205/8808_1 /TAXON_ID=0 /ORGANISM="Stereomyxa ramosa, Strain Chinc5" /LENGTH=1516 /DNA_ID=CAMNT_0015344207 /DNA_START=18 /DNA_END=4568 /DNA_ORIENTATION=-
MTKGGNALFFLLCLFLSISSADVQLNLQKLILGSTCGEGKDGTVCVQGYRHFPRVENEKSVFTFCSSPKDIGQKTTLDVDLFVWDPETIGRQIQVEVYMKGKHGEKSLGEFLLDINAFGGAQTNFPVPFVTSTGDASCDRQTAVVLLVLKSLDKKHLLPASSTDLPNLYVQDVFIGSDCGIKRGVVCVEGSYTGEGDSTFFYCIDEIEPRETYSIDQDIVPWDSSLIEEPVYVKVVIHAENNYNQMVLGEFVINPDSFVVGSDYPVNFVAENEASDCENAYAFVRMGVRHTGLVPAKTYDPNRPPVNLVLREISVDSLCGAEDGLVCVEGFKFQFPQDPDAEPFFKFCTANVKSVGKSYAFDELLYFWDTVEVGRQILIKVYRTEKKRDKEHNSLGEFLLDINSFAGGQMDYPVPFVTSTGSRECGLKSASVTLLVHPAIEEQKMKLPSEAKPGSNSNTNFDAPESNTNYDAPESNTNYDAPESNTNYDAPESNTNYDAPESNTNYDVHYSKQKSEGNTHGGSVYVEPEIHGGGAHVEPEIHGGGAHVEPEIHGGGAHVEPEVHGGGVYEKPDTHRGSSYVEPEIHSGGGVYVKPDTHGGSGGVYVEPEIHGGGAHVKPDVHSGGVYVEPEVHSGGGGVYKKPDTNRDSSYVEPEIHGGGAYVEPEIHGGGVYVKPDTHTGGVYVEPEVQGGGVYRPASHSNTNYDAPESNTNYDAPESNTNYDAPESNTNYDYVKHKEETNTGSETTGAGGAYVKPDVQGGGVYVKPDVQGGGVYVKPDTHGGGVYIKPDPIKPSNPNIHYVKENDASNAIGKPGSNTNTNFDAPESNTNYDAPESNTNVYFDVKSSAGGRKTDSNTNTNYDVPDSNTNTNHDAPESNTNTNTDHGKTDSNTNENPGRVFSVTSESNTNTNVNHGNEKTDSNTNENPGRHHGNSIHDIDGLPHLFLKDVSIDSFCGLDGENGNSAVRITGYNPNDDDEKYFSYYIWDMESVYTHYEFDKDLWTWDFSKVGMQVRITVSVVGTGDEVGEEQSLGELVLDINSFGGSQVEFPNSYRTISDNDDCGRKESTLTFMLKAPPPSPKTALLSSSSPVHLVLTQVYLESSCGIDLAGTGVVKIRVYDLVSQNSDARWQIGEVALIDLDATQRDYFYNLQLIDWDRDTQQKIELEMVIADNLDDEANEIVVGSQVIDYHYFGGGQIGMPVTTYFAGENQKCPDLSAIVKLELSQGGQTRKEYYYYHEGYMKEPIVIDQDFDQIKPLPAAEQIQEETQDQVPGDVLQDEVQDQIQPQPQAYPDDTKAPVWLNLNEIMIGSDCGVDLKKESICIEGHALDGYDYSEDGDKLFEECLTGITKVGEFYKKNHVLYQINQEKISLTVYLGEERRNLGRLVIFSEYFAGGTIDFPISMGTSVGEEACEYKSALMVLSLKTGSRRHIMKAAHKKTSHDDSSFLPFWSIEVMLLFMLPILVSLLIIVAIWSILNKKNLGYRQMVEPERHEAYALHDFRTQPSYGSTARCAV